MQSKKQEYPAWQWALAGLMVVVFVVFWISGGFDQHGGRPNPKVCDGVRHSHAFTGATGFVRQRLRAPSTARFAGLGAANISHDESCIFTVSSYVDAENAFGARIRTRFVARVSRLPDGWRLHSLTGL